MVKIKLFYNHFIYAKLLKKITKKVLIWYKSLGMPGFLKPRGGDTAVVNEA
jgi:hypothetical protein